MPTEVISRPVGSQVIWVATGGLISISIISNVCVKVGPAFLIYYGPAFLQAQCSDLKISAHNGLQMRREKQLKTLLPVDKPCNGATLIFAY